MKSEQGTTRVGRRLIEDFLLPALNDERYGDRLKWVDKDKLCFSIRWSHKNAAKWSLEDTVVFQDWDRLKGHFHPEIKGYYMQAKQRFRAALYKLNTVRKVRTEDKHTKVYQLVLENDKKRNSDSSAKRDDRLLRKEGRICEGIPTPVICFNGKYVHPDNVLKEDLHPINVTLEKLSPKPVEDMKLTAECSSCESNDSSNSIVTSSSDNPVVSPSNSMPVAEQLQQVRQVQFHPNSHRHPHIPVQIVPEQRAYFGVRSYHTLRGHMIYNSFAENDDLPKKFVLPPSPQPPVNDMDEVLNLSLKPASYERTGISVPAR